MKIKYKFKKVRPSIYLITSNSYDLGMLFFRMQEYYESENKQLYRRPVSFFEAMRIYSKKRSKKKTFSYFKDWVGFNIPSDILDEYMKSCGEMTPYDKEIQKVVSTIRKETEQFYLIGAPNKKTKRVLKHEVAHGLYYTNTEYKNEVTKLIEALPKKIHKQAHKKLRSMGYNKSVRDDELQAYFATGLEDLSKLKKHAPPFRKLFKKFYKETKL